jgi:hypothetical protein
MYPDQSVYMGNWENGQRSGNGTFRNLDGTKYEGDWAKDLRNGAGRLSLPNGDVVEGSWKKDELHGKIQYSFADGDILRGQYQKGTRIGDVSVTLKDSGKEQTFPWPETDASTAEGQAHAARDHAKSLFSELLFVSIFFGEFYLNCFQNWQSAQEKRKRKTKRRKRITPLRLALKPPMMTWIATLVSYSQLICHRHYDPPQTYAATRASVPLAIVPAPAPNAPVVSAVAKSAQAPNSTNTCCFDQLVYIIHSFFLQTTHHHSGLWHVWVSG